MSDKAVAMRESAFHFDDAWREAKSGLSQFLLGKPGAWRAVLIADVTGRLRVILWCPKGDWASGRKEVHRVMADAGGPYWSQGVIQAEDREHPDVAWQNRAWERASGVTDADDRLRVLKRHRSKAAWFDAPAEPPWPGGQDECAIALFYSFKGGVGRSTALAATALRLAASGERVVVIDADLDAPGVGSLLVDLDGAIAPHGIVDYLLEQPVLEAKGMVPKLDEYYHRSAIRDSGNDREILVFPAGTLGPDFIHKLARVDYANPLDGRDHALVALMHHVREELEPSWILIDSRAGLGEVSGFLTGGFCHINVLFGALAESSWHGTELLLDRLGRQRLQESNPRSQSECIWVAAMIPRQQQQYKASADAFLTRSRDLFSERYYADPEYGEDFWTTDDLEAIDSPHVPVVIPYEPLLADYRQLAEVVDSVSLKDSHCREIVERLRMCRKRL